MHSTQNIYQLLVLAIGANNAEFNRDLLLFQGIYTESLNMCC